MKNKLKSNGSNKINRISKDMVLREFVARNSLLTDLMEIIHIGTIYNISLAAFFSITINTIVRDYFTKGEVNLALNLIFNGFSKIQLWLPIWICMFASSQLVYLGFKCWALVRIQLVPKSIKLKLWDRLSLFAFIASYLWFVYFTPKAVVVADIPTVTSLIILCEMTRFMMKSHAFVRSNAPRVLNYKLHAENEILYPEYSKFLYFSFAPTLIYQDDYPRTEGIRWDFVAKRFLEFLLVTYFLSVVLETYYLPSFGQYGLKYYSWQETVLMIMDKSWPAMFIVLLAFFGILHSWMNAFAEMLRFSDRKFYGDWWTANTHEQFYRKWNGIVHEWLFVYIYTDLCNNVMPNHKISAKILTFFVSAVFHDFILGFTARFCLPILFMLFFFIGVSMVFLKIKNNLIGNVFIWFTTATGTGIITSLYSIEYFFRLNCPIDEITFISYFVPRLLTCDKFS